MNDASLRDAAEAHARAIFEGDMAGAQADLVEDLHPAMASVSEVLPSPLTSADVISVTAHDDHGESVIAYRGVEETLAMRARWEQRGPRLLIVSAEPVAVD